jgi:hypothetical protein
MAVRVSNLRPLEALSLAVSGPVESPHEKAAAKPFSTRQPPAASCPAPRAAGSISMAAKKYTPFIRAASAELAPLGPNRAR